MAQFHDITGEKFGRLTVIRRASNDKHGNAQWECRCECESLTVVRTYSLRNGDSTSCGCRRADVSRKLHTAHGEAKRKGARPTTEYVAYHSAKARCQNPKSMYYSEYGGRGIQFRFSSFDEFLQEIGRKPSPEHSVDRINNDGHYEPGNVRWATRKEQAWNRRPQRRKTGRHY